MKVWCARHGNGERFVCIDKPLWCTDEPYRGFWSSGTILLTDVHNKLLNGIFPRGIKPGECKAVTIKRWEVDDV